MGRLKSGERKMTTRRIHTEMRDIVELHKKGLLTREQVVHYYETLKAIRKRS